MVTRWVNPICDLHLRSGDPARQPGTFDPGWQRLWSPGHSVLALWLEGPHLRGWLQPEAAKVAVTHCFAKVPHGFMYTWSWVKMHNGIWFSIFDLLICVCVFSCGAQWLSFQELEAGTLFQVPSLLVVFIPPAGWPWAMHSTEAWRVSNCRMDWKSWLSADCLITVCKMWRCRMVFKSSPWVKSSIGAWGKWHCQANFDS